VERIFDAEGRFVETINGPIGMTFGNDGKTAWTRDIGGEVHALALGDRSAALLRGGIASHIWFMPGAAMEFRADGEHTTDSTVALAFAHDDGRINGRVEINTSDWMPARWIFEVPPTITTIEFAGTTTLGGLHLPATIHSSSTNGTDNTFTIKELAEAPTFFRSPYQFLATAYPDTTFDPAVPAVLDVKRATTGHILVHPRINGKDVGWFIFDTGAGITVLDTKTCDTLGLQRTGSIPAMGVGGAAKSGLARIEQFSLGPVAIKNELVLDLNIAFLSPLMGEEIAGIVGYPVLARSVVSMDMQAPAVSIYDPASYTLTGGEWSPLHVYERHPCIDGVVEGHPGVFRLETGAGASTVTFHVPFIERFKLLEGRETTASMMGGVGGMVPSKNGTIQSMTIGGHTQEKFSAAFATERKGVFADPYLAGNLGGALVSPFVVTLHYQNNRIAFVPKAKAEAKP
jgi:hypothetical protein